MRNVLPVLTVCSVFCIVAVVMSEELVPAQVGFVRHVGGVCSDLDKATEWVDGDYVVELNQRISLAGACIDIDKAVFCLLSGPHISERSGSWSLLITQTLKITKSFKIVLYVPLGEFSWMCLLTTVTQTTRRTHDASSKEAHQLLLCLGVSGSRVPRHSGYLPCALDDNSGTGSRPGSWRVV